MRVVCVGLGPDKRRDGAGGAPGAGSMTVGPSGTTAAVPDVNTAEVVCGDPDTVEVVLEDNSDTVEAVSTGTVEAVPTGTVEAVPTEGVEGVAVPLSGFTQARPPFYFGGEVPTPAKVVGVGSVPAPSSAAGQGLPFLRVPEVAAARARWLEQLDRLGERPGADLALLQEVRAAVVDGVKQEFPAGAPPPGVYSNTYTFRLHERDCLERLRVYEDLGALRRVAEQEGSFSFVQPLHAVVKQEKKTRVCMDMSRNFNDYLADQPFRMTSVAAGVRLAQECPGRAWFVKLDISACFLSFPLHPDDWKYYVCKAGGDYMQFMRMVFGLKSAPRTASLLLDVVSSALADAGVAHIRYLDDFFLVATSRERAWVCAHKAAELIKEFGLALSPGKVEGPSQRLEFLGIVLDSQAETLSISEGRKAELLGLLQDFKGRRWASLAKLQSLLGKLSFAATVLPGARPFLRRIIDTTRVGRGRLLLGPAFRADVAYWEDHIGEWNGRCRWRKNTDTPFVFGSDASTGGFAYGLESCSARAMAKMPGHMRPGHVRMGCWSWSAGHAAKQRSSSEIQWGEFFAPLAAAVEYGALLANSHVVFVVDNESDVHVINRMRTREPRVCGLLRALCDTALRHNFSFAAVHRPGKDNDVMDWASRPDRHAFAGDAAAFAPPPSHGTPCACARSVPCGVLRYTPLSRPTSLTLLNSRCLKFAASGSSASWERTCGGW